VGGAMGGVGPVTSIWGRPLAWCRAQEKWGAHAKFWRDSLYKSPCRPHFQFLTYFFIGLWCHSDDKVTIHSIPFSWIFYKPTISQGPPSHLRDYSTCNNACLEFSTIFVPSFDPNEWCLKNGLYSGGLNPGPLGRSWVFCLNHKTTATRLKTKR
jgi:hypothetical protein